MGNSILSPQKQDIFCTLRDWIDKNIQNGKIQPKIFIKNGRAHRFVIKQGDIEFSYEVGDKI